MNYTSSTSFNLSFSNSNRTAKPSNPFYFRKNYSYEPQGPVLYRLNMPLQFDHEIILMPVIDNFRQENSNFYLCLNDALNRYKEINNGTIFDSSIADAFLCALKNVCSNMNVQPYIIFNKLTTKVQLIFNNKDFVLDYDHEDQDTILVMSSNNETLVVKESILDRLEETLRSF